MVALRSLFWSTPSSTPVTVTVWAVFQLMVVKVSIAGLTVAAAGALEVTTTVTLAVGLASSTIV